MESLKILTDCIPKEIVELSQQVYSLTNEKRQLEDELSLVNFELTRSKDQTSK